jgi:catechol 2,3-dioxygenase-like lactoylglutathione lyase family enzyme
MYIRCRQEDRMRVIRIMANLRVADVEAAKSFYTGYLGLSTEEFNMGWVARYTSPDASTRVQLVTRDATAPEDPVISVHTDDVGGAYEEAHKLGLRDRVPDDYRAMGCAPVLRPGTRLQRNQHREPSGLKHRRGEPTSAPVRSTTAPSRRIRHWRYALAWSPKSRLMPGLTTNGGRWRRVLSSGHAATTPT